MFDFVINMMNGLWELMWTPGIGSLIWIFMFVNLVLIYYGMFVEFYSKVYHDAKPYVIKFGKAVKNHYSN